MPCRSRMDTVPNPIGVLRSRSSAENFIEHRIIRKKYRLIVLRYPLYDGGTATHQTITFCKVLTLTHIADIGNKRSAQHYLQFRIGLQRTVKQGTVTLLPSFKIKRLFFVTL